MPIINKYKDTTGAGSEVLAKGELATNTVDGTLYVGNGVANVLLVDTGAEVLPSGTEGQTLRNNAGAWEATSDLTVDASGNVDATGDIAAVDITASGNMAAVGITASGNMAAVDVAASGNIGAVDITASGDVGAVDITASGEVTSDHGVSVGAKDGGTQALTDSIVTVTQAEYDGLTKDNNTLYIIV